MRIRPIVVWMMLLGASAYAFAASDSIAKAAEARLSEEALARYSAPGNPARYGELLQWARVPVEELGDPASGLKLPVQSWPDGRTRTLVLAKEAWISGEDLAWVRGRRVRVEQFRADGELEGVLEADEVAVDRASMLAVVKGRVKGNFGNDRLTGVGALVDLDANYVKILKKAEILTKRLGDAKLTERGIF